MNGKIRFLTIPTVGLIAAGLLLYAPRSGGAGISSGAATSNLENGLAIILRPVPSATSVALVVLFDVGEDQDPAGSSGLAHLVEHIYLTAAAGPRKSQDFQEFVSGHPLGWNAQTGSRYTVLATVFPPENTEAELAEAASRLKDLRVTGNDLSREKPRVIAELRNMYAGLPVLAGLNHGRELVRPSLNGGRKGGRENEVAAITLAQVRDRLSSFYKPANATLVLAGSFVEQKTRLLIGRLFADIPKGKKISEIPRGEKPLKEADRFLELRLNQPGASPLAFLVFRVPEPKDQLYPAFLLLAARLNNQAWRLGAGSLTLHFAPLDDPEVLGISAALKPGESGKAAVARLREFVRESIPGPIKPADIFAAKNFFGFFLGFPGLPEAVFSQNIYGLAFSLARRQQLDIDGIRLASLIEKVSTEDLSSATPIFETKNSAAVIIK
ncbi:MAG TPA: insulinase family protein [Acidobacteriota bacterium]